MTTIKLYVEGGGSSKELHTRCREGFRKLLERAGFSGRMPRIVAGGSRNATFDLFKLAARNAQASEYPILLVDSEDVVENAVDSWAHLRSRDGWCRPPGVSDDQAQLMVTCMETWIVADRDALRSYFGSSLHESHLFVAIELERRDRHSVQDTLVAATRDCKRKYCKGKRSFEVLAELHPDTLKAHLPHFVALTIALEEHL